MLLSNTIYTPPMVLIIFATCGFIILFFILRERSKVRIVERVYVDDKTAYVIQQKHFLFFWIWVDASVNSLDYVNCEDTFETLEMAKQNICYFDGSKFTDRVVK